MKLALGAGAFALALALGAPAVAQNGAYHYQDYRHGWQGRLSADDQQRFDSYYSRWLNYRRENNRDQVESMEKRMRDVMAHYNIPGNTPFGEIASNGGGYDRGYNHDRDRDRDRDRDHDRYYGNSDWSRRLPADDQQRFDSYYSRWLNYRRENNRDQIESMEKRMRDVMAHNNIPPDVPFGEIASRR
jgi:hypothetical protein